MARDAALMGISVDPLRLYHADEDTQNWLDGVLEDVYHTRQRIQGGG